MKFIGRVIFSIINLLDALVTFLTLGYYYPGWVMNYLVSDFWRRTQTDKAP